MRRARRTVTSRRGHTYKRGSRKMRAYKLGLLQLGYLKTTALVRSLKGAV